MEEILNKNKYDNYLKDDGSINIKENTSYLTIEKAKINNCTKCGYKVNLNNTYCNNCGEILEDIKSKREKFINQEEDRVKFKDIVINFDLINGLKTSALSIFILFVLSFIIKVGFMAYDNQMTELINPLHIMIFSNLASMNIVMSLFMNSAQSSFNIGFIGLLILPIISFILPYNIFMKNRNKSFINSVKNSLGVAIIYSVILTLLSNLCQIDIDLSNSYNGFMQYSYGHSQYGVYLGFSLISTLFNSFIIGFMTTLFMGIKKEYENESMIAYSLKLVLKTILSGYLLVLIIGIGLHFMNVNCIYELGLNSYINDLSIGAVFSQLGIYLWAFANLIPVSVGNGYLTVFSLFSSNMSLDLALFLGAIIALSALIFIIIGSKLESKFKDKTMRPVLIFGGFYAITMGIIGILTTIYIGDNVSSMLSSISAVYMGFDFFIGMIISFIYSSTMTLIGYKLNIFN